MKRMLLLAAVAGAVSATAVQAQAPAGTPDLAKAQSIIKDVCAACHGTNGNSASAANPNLAGQSAEYITLQLMNFQSGVRVNPVMQGMAAALKPEDMKALGAYFSQQKPKGLGAKDAALVTAGQKLYRGGDTVTGIPACAACHAPNGAGIAKNYPRLAGQYADYTYAQLKAFKNDDRGADKDGRDINGKIMTMVAFKMSDAQMKAVAEYTSGLR
jgi:cytochrome c553